MTALGGGSGSDLRGRSVTLRDVVEDDVLIFFRHQSDPVTAQMAQVAPRDEPTYLARWARLLTDPTVATKTVLVDGVVAGHVMIFTRNGIRELGYWLGRESGVTGSPGMRYSSILHSSASALCSRSLRSTTWRHVAFSNAVGFASAVRKIMSCTTDCGLATVHRHRDSITRQRDPMDGYWHRRQCRCSWSLDRTESERMRRRADRRGSRDMRGKWERAAEGVGCGGLFTICPRRIHCSRASAANYREVVSMASVFWIASSIT